MGRNKKTTKELEVIQGLEATCPSSTDQYLTCSFLVLSISLVNILPTKDWSWSQAQSQKGVMVMGQISYSVIQLVFEPTLGMLLYF
jgi:hypothetical protein